MTLSGFETEVRCFLTILIVLSAALWLQKRRTQSADKALRASEQAQPDEQLRLANHLLLAQLETSLNGILVVDESMRILSYNQRFVTLWEIPPRSLETREANPILQSMMFKTANPEAFLAKLRYLYAHPEETSIDEILLLNGNIFERYSAPLKGADGTYFGRIWYFHDISERKRMEDKLHRSDARFRALTQNSTDVIGITDANGIIQYRSLAVTKILGYSPGEVIGTDVFQYFHPDDLARARENFTLLKRSPLAILREEYRIRHKDGSWRDIENISANYLDDPAIQGVVFNYRDIGGRKKAEEELRQLSSRILNLRDEESRRIARDLHDSTAQKLAALQINLSIARSLAAKINSDGESMLNECVELAQTCTQEIRTLSYLLHPPLLDELGLGDAIREYADGFAERSGIRVDLELQPDLDDLPKELELALFRILQESLSNIRRHSGSKTASVRVVKIRNEIQLEVKDAGRGMPVKVTTANGLQAAAKTGVGISSMRERLRLLGGHLEIDTGPGGTTIRAIVSHTNK